MGNYENHLQFAFPGPFTGSNLKFSTFLQETSDVGNIVHYVKANGTAVNLDQNPVKVYVNQFAENIQTTVTNPLGLQTDYITYLVKDDQFVGSFRGNAAVVPAPSVDTFEILTREPNRLEVQVTFYEETGVPFDVLIQIGNNDFTGVTPTFSNELTRTFTFDQLEDGSLIDTVTTYTVYVHVINAHESNSTTQFEVPGSLVASLTLNTFQLVSMGNLDTDGEIRLSVDFSSDTSLSNVSYYVTAYSPGEGPGTLIEMIQPEANVDSGLLVSGTNNAVLDRDYRGNSFVEEGNVIIQGLLVHEDTNKYYNTQIGVITMDVPKITLTDENSETYALTLHL